MCFRIDALIEQSKLDELKDPSFLVELTRYGDFNFP